jgi:CelD/BcsL family acetyltransferase involved in cellulose biosynthesis
MDMEMMRVDPRDSPVWKRLVDQTASSVFHSPPWMQVLSDTYGWEPFAYVVLNSRGEPCAGLPCCRIADVFGERIVSLPFSDYCDPLVSDPQCWRVLVERLLPEHCPITVRCLHNDIPLADERFAPVKQTKWHGLDLRPDLDTLWRAMHDSKHRAIRKSQREGVHVRVAESEQELRAFYEMHLKIRKYKLGMLAQPFLFFQNIWRRFVEPGHGFLLLAFFQDRTVAGDYFLEWKDTLYYKFNASLVEDLAHRPNDLLMWEGIQRGKARGLKFLDLGLSDWDQEGLVRYKRMFGTQEKAISFLRYTPNGGPTAAEKGMRDLLSRMTRHFTDHLVPDAVTEKAGEDLYRLFV